MLLFLFTWLSCSFPDSTERQEMVVAVVLQCGAKRVQVWSSCWGHTSAPPCGILLVHPYRDLHNLLWICTWHELLEKGGRAWDGGVGRSVWFYSLVPGCGVQNGAFDLFRTPYGNSVRVAPSGCPKGRERAATAPGDSAQCRPSEEFFLHHVEVATHIEPSN